MNSNPEKCKELIIPKKGFNEVILPLHNIPQCTSVVILGMTFQENGKFSMQVKAKTSGTSDSDLTVIQKFLDRCHKRHYISEKVDVRELLQNADLKLYNKRVLDKEQPLKSQWIIVTISDWSFSDQSKDTWDMCSKNRVLGTDTILRE